MAGYWPSSVFCVFVDRDGVEVHKHAKKERGQYQAILTEQAWSAKDLLYGFWENFSFGTRRVVPSGQDGSILPARAGLGLGLGFISPSVFSYSWALHYFLTLLVGCDFIFGLSSSLYK